MVGKPFRKPFYTNLWFTISFIVLLIINLLVTFNPFKWKIIYNPYYGGEWPFPNNSGWINKLFILVIINSICTLIWERVFVAYFSRKWKHHRDQKEYQRVIEESRYVPPKVIIDEARESLEQS